MRLRFAYEKHEDRLLDDIASDLITLGFLPATKGFVYLCHLIYLSVKQEENRYSIKKELIPQVAYMFENKPINVERTCRHALDGAYLSGGLKNINDLFGFSYLKPYERPTFQNFVITMVEKSLLNHKNYLTGNKRSLLLKLNKLFSPKFNFAISKMAISPNTSV